MGYDEYYHMHRRLGSTVSPHRNIGVPRTAREQVAEAHVANSQK